MRHVTPRLAALLLAAYPAAAAAQSPQPRPLGRPEAEFDEPFTQIGAVRELRDGRVVVSDPRDKTVQLIDMKSGTATAIGREGSGPGEYALPMGLIAVPGDSTLVYDPLNSRFLYVLPNGKPGGFYSPQRDEATEAPRERGATRLSIGGMRFGPGGIRGVDNRGRLYYQSVNFSIGPNGPQTADSAAIARLDRATGKVDTIAFIKTPAPNVNASGSGNQRNVSVMIGPPNPFTPLDQWTVTPDGRVVIARAADYHLDVIGPDGRRVAGPAVRFDRIRVTDRDKTEWRENLRNAQTIGLQRTNVNGRTSTSASAASPRANLPEPTDWPDVKPPFTQNAIFATPSGDVWVQRSRQAGDKVPVYDVFDGQGRMTGRVALPAGGRLVGFGNGTVYVVRNDEDDLQYLQRYRMP